MRTLIEAFEMNRLCKVWFEFPAKKPIKKPLLDGKTLY